MENDCMATANDLPKYTANEILEKYNFDILKHLAPGEKANETTQFIVMNSDNFDLS